MSEHETSLKGLFASAKEQQEHLDILDTQSPDFRETQQSIVKTLEECRILISQLSLYSPNETIEDISTQDLQYFGVDYLLAETLLKSYGSDRMGQLKKASNLLEAFLTQLDRYEILSNSDRKLYERYQENRKRFSVVSSKNLEERRKQKISRFREEKALKNRLNLLRDRSSIIHVDDEVIRNLYLAEIALFTYESFQSLDMISQEMLILSQIRVMEPLAQANDAKTDTRQESGTGEPYSERLDGPVTMGGLGRRGGPLLSSSGKPLQPFTLTDKRTQLQKGVFRPGHNLPTMSIDEYLEEERKRGGIIEGGGNANTGQQELDEDNMEQVDAATMKAREWDEFVEANPKGAGNTLNRG